MAFFSSSFSTTISQPKMRQEGFHLPSPSPSNGNPPSPPSTTGSNAFDIFMPHHSSHQQHSAPHTASGSGSQFPGLSLPDAFSRSGGAMDFGDELASLIASSPATSNERSTHTPPYEHHGHGGHHGAGTSSAEGPYRPTHNIFDISAPSSTHFNSQGQAGAHAFSLPHTSHRPEIPPLSQPASLHTSHHAFDQHHAAHPSHHTHDFHTTHHHPGLSRDGFPAHFNSTIPPLSNHHDPPAPTPDQQQQQQQQNHTQVPYGQAYTPTSSGSAPPRETPSPPGAPGRATSRPATGHRRSGSRSRSRARGATGSAPGGGAGASGASGSTGPTRTPKSANKRRDSFTHAHVPHSHGHAHQHGHGHGHGHGHSVPGMLHHHGAHPHSPGLASPTVPSSARPQAIVIPSQHGHGGHHAHMNGRVGAGPSSPLSLSTPGVVGQTSGWFLPGQNGNPGSAPGEFSLPTPESIGQGHAFGQFGTSVGSMGMSPKESTLGGKSESPPMDPVSKQAAIVNEKRRRRRESHNAVERRRRDNINEKISELATLIPEMMLDPAAAASSANSNAGEETFQAGEQGKKRAGSNPASSNAEDAATAAGDQKENGAVKANKGMILRKSVEYIRYLQQLVNIQAVRNRQLEQQLVRAGIQDTGAKGDVEAQALSQASNHLNGANGTPAFGDEVLSLHTFGADADDVSAYMDMGMSMGFNHLEPMAEGGEMELEMDGEVGMGALEYQKHGGAGAKGGRRGVGAGDADREGTSPSAGSEEDAVSTRDVDDEREELEERGRRDRDGRVPNGSVTVKEESAHMEM